MTYERSTTRPLPENLPDPKAGEDLLKDTPASGGGTSGGFGSFQPFGPPQELRPVRETFGSDDDEEMEDEEADGDEYESYQRKAS